LGSKEVPPVILEFVATLDYPVHPYMASFSGFEEVQRAKEDKFRAITLRSYDQQEFIISSYFIFKVKLILNT
jgi:hypothetical protein